MELRKKLRAEIAEEMLAFWEWDIQADTEYWSAAFFELLGYELDEISASYQEWESRLHPEDKEKTLEILESHFETKALFDLDYRLLCKDGKYRWFRAKGKTIYDKKGVPLRMGGTLEDVSDLYRQRDLFKEANEALEETNQQLRQFAYAASHDLLEPLRVIQGYAKLLNNMELDIDPEAQSYLDWMVDATSRMSDMIDGLLDYSRLNNEQHFATVSMYSAYEYAKASLAQQITQSGAIINCCSTLPAVVGIKSQIQRLLQNLFSNAIKYSDPSRPPNIMLEVIKENGEVTFAVSDNGIGIRKKHYKKIFKLFKRLHSVDKYQGTGMGLALCQRIIERHEGKIWLESALGKGSTFYFTLPTHK